MDLPRSSACPCRGAYWRVSRPPTSPSASARDLCLVRVRAARGLVLHGLYRRYRFRAGAFSLQNFVDAYGDWSILKLFWNSLVFAAGTAFLTFFMGGVVACAVERTDIPGPRIFPFVGAAFLRAARSSHDHGLDADAEPQYRLGQFAGEESDRRHRSSISIRWAA